MEGVGDDVASATAPFAKYRSDLSRMFQHYLDKLTPLASERWIGTGVLATFFLLRVYLVQGFYLISYALGIYLLNLLIGFMSPKVDPELEALDGAALPTKGSDEFKPFIRRLPEFKFCDIFPEVACRGERGYSYGDILRKEDPFGPSGHIIEVGLAFDVPVFWPILLCYWIVLFVLTMKRQILHMIKYKYIPFNIGKRKYTGKKSAASGIGSPRD
ncbi:hypothetical protein IFM89_010766 [Coptis chinensis]|uniref:Protein RER1 n=1 Tax=Coptis chinensis TaxID=261450 RepID=A0A835ILE6_9MAGN|nr:hypothetical protein IFM89_010766 [Coptis chinensis]